MGKPSAADALIADVGGVGGATGVHVPALPWGGCSDPLDPDDCDTLESDACTSMDACYERVAKAACEQPATTGILLLGTLALTRSVVRTWRLDSGPDGHCPHKLYASLVRVKSWPRGRLGQPLVANEVRRICILLRTQQGPVLRADDAEAVPEKAQLCTLVLWRQPVLERPPPMCTTEDDLRCGSRAVYGIGCVGVHLFCHQGREFLEDQKLTHGRRQFHALLGSAIGVVRSTTPDGQATMVSDTIHNVVLAATIHGTPLHDLPARRPPMRVLTLAILQNKQYESARGLVNMCSARGSHSSGLASGPQPTAEQQARHLEADAAAVSELLSMRGLMHLLAVFGREHLPDGLWQCQRNSIGLVMALAMRIALCPKAVDLDEGDCPHEALARRAARRALEAVVPDVQPHEEGASAAPQFALDACIRTAMKSATRALASSQNHSAHDEACEADVAVHESLRCLQSLGMSVILDAFGVPGRLTRQVVDHSTSLANEVDLALQRHARAVTHGVSDAAPPSAFFVPGRATRATLQHTVLAHLVAAEHSLTPRVSLHAVATGVDKPPPPVVAQLVPNDGASTDVALAVAVPVGQRVVAPRQCGKKKKKRPPPSPPPLPPETPQQKGPEADGASSSPAAPSTCPVDTTAAAVAAYLEDVLRLGNIAGLTHLAEPRAFLVAPTMEHQCGRGGGMALDSPLHAALAAILDGDAPALLRLVLDTPLPLTAAMGLAIQAHRSDVRRGVDGLPVHRHGCLAAVFFGIARRQQLLLEEEAEDVIGQVEEAVHVLGSAAAKADDSSLLDVLMDLEPRATLSTTPGGVGTRCEMDRFFISKRAPRCLARWRAVHARGPSGVRIDRIYHTFEHAKTRLATEAARQLARLSDGATKEEDTTLEQADAQHVATAGANVDPRRLLRQLLRVLVRVGRVEILPTHQGTSSFGLSLLGRSELVVRCAEDDRGSHRRLRRFAQRTAEEVDDARALQRLPIEGHTSASRTMLSELLAPLAHLRPAEVPLALLLADEDPS